MPSLHHSILAIGAFDGVHIGHQTLIRKLVEHSKQMGVPSVVYTFDPPPRVFFRNARQLTSIEEKVNRIAKLGVDHIVIAQFDESYLRSNASQFIKSLFRINPVEVIVGRDFHFGKNRSGGMKDLQEHFKVTLHETICCEEGEVISSTRIRELIAHGNDREAQSLLNW